MAVFFKYVHRISEMASKKQNGQIVWRFVPFRDPNSARDRPAIVVQARLELVVALIARF